MRKVKYALLILFIITGLAVFAGCQSLFGNNTGITAIRVEETSIYLAPTGRYSEYQLNPVAVPTELTDEYFTYSVLDPQDAQYLIVSNKGLLKALGKEKEGHIIVRIRSVSKPSVYLDVFVNIVIAQVEKITFDTASFEIVLGSEPQQIQPIIKPYYAEVGATLGYEILDTTIATVDIEGRITPLKRGTTTIRVYTIVGYGEESVEAMLEVNVVYADLNYHIGVRDERPWVFKQINATGGYESFWIDIWKEESDPCDPDPEITWRIDGTAIRDSSLQGKKSILFDPEALHLTVGNYQITAELKSGSKIQTLNLPLLKIYAPLTTFNIVNQTIKDSYEINDTIKIAATHGTGQYPPDSYDWYLQDADNSSSPEIFLASTAPIVNGETQTGIFDYDVDRVGKFKIICYAVVKGVHGVRAEVVLNDMISSTTGNDIYGVYIDGALRSGVYVPYVKWSPLPYNATYEVEIRNDTTMESYTLKSAINPEPFTKNGVYLPQNTVTLNDSFSVKIKSDRYGFSRWYSYEASDIDSAHYEYLELIDLDYNSYIVNMEELGELLNYVSVFRPEALEDSSTPNKYNLTIYVPFDYDSVKDIYPKNEDSNSSSTDPEEINAFNLINAAFNCYAESGRFGLSYSVGANGEFIISLNFTGPHSDTYLSTDPSPNSEYPFEPHYTKTVRTGTVLPIDSNPRTLPVSTSNQLFLAASLGYRPVPVPGSGAELIYTEAREVLFRINNNSMNDAQKIHAIYDFLTTEVLYDHELVTLMGDEDINLYDGFYLEGVFLKGKAVCDGIAKAFNLLCWMEGIASKKVSGMVERSGNILGHAWNKVNVNGEWYLVDATWGSSLDGSNHKEIQTHRYLLTTDASVSGTHTAYGVYPATITERHNIYITYQIATGVTPLIDTDSDIEAVIDNYMLTIFETEDEAWLEVYVAPQYILGLSNPSEYISYLQTKVGEALTGGTGLAYSVTGLGENFVVIRVVRH